MSTTLERLVKAQANFKPVKKTMTGQIQSRSYKYADLGEVVEATEPALHEAGLSLVQYGEMRGNVYGLVTALRCTDDALGLVYEMFYPIDYAEMTQQEIGSALTYARRYSRSTILGIVTEEDDDGAGATAAKQETRSTGNISKNPACPECGMSGSVMKSKFADADWFCFKKRGGCGYSWYDTTRPQPSEPPREGAPPEAATPKKAGEGQIILIRNFASKLGLNAMTLQPILKKCAPNAPVDNKGMIRSDVLTAGEAAIVIQELQKQAGVTPTEEGEVF